MSTTVDYQQDEASPIQAEVLLSGILAAAKAALPQGLDVLVWGAARLGDHATLRYLLENGGGTSWTYPMDGEEPWRGSSCFWVASRNGHEGAVKELLEYGVNVDEAKAVSGTTPLYTAAHQGHEGVVEQLVKAGADLNKATTSNGSTPLHIASAKGHEGVVEQLLKEGADAGKGMIDHGATSLYMAAASGHTGVVEQLVKAGVDIDKARTDDGATPLHIAADKEHDGVVEVLLKAGANPNAEMHNGRTPLSLATKRDHSRVCSILLKAGANVDHDVAIQHRTALKLAMMFGSRRAALVLMEHGALCDDAILTRVELEQLMRWSTEALKERNGQMDDKDSQMERLVQGIPEWCAQAASRLPLHRHHQRGNDRAATTGPQTRCSLLLALILESAASTRNLQPLYQGF